MQNTLRNEKSPYLLQHKDNPVAWQPWGEAACRLAAEQDKPIFLSIGYSTCYWCHVMEKDSFEHDDVAELLNTYFVPVKVDREELPDVDAIYMDVVVGIHGQGGWPMSVFLTPDGKPFWGGTFFYKAQFKAILQGIHEAWKNEREKILRSSNELTVYLARKQPGLRQEPLDPTLTARAAEQLYGRYDTRYGGFGGAPKFPPAQQIHFLLRVHAETQSAAAREAAVGTLRAMALGGIFDQLGGGFHRYSVDERWLIPHFEKMLYDNALLVPAYLEAYQLTGDELFRDTAQRTLEYLLREMQAPEGAFFTAQDAGEVDKEGEFYAWNPSQVAAICSPTEAEEFCSLYSISAHGNFEHGTSVLALASRDDWATSQGVVVQAIRERLLAERSKRSWPHRDEKILAGWNGLAIRAFALGYKVLGNKRYRDAAESAGRFVVESMTHDGTLQRRYFGGSVGIDAMLEDYAYLIQGLLALYESTGDSHWLTAALRLHEEQDARLWSSEHKAYVTSAQKGLIVSVCDWDDGATPSPNGIALMNLLWIAQLTGEARWDERLEALVEGVPAAVMSVPMAYTSTVTALWARGAGLSTVSVLAASATEKEEPERDVFALWRHFLPLTAVSWGEASAKVPGVPPTASQGRFYVCKGRVCLEPTVEVEAVLRLCSVAKKAA
jgi:uncharacterized protein YyaL (SSP411 family)